MPCDCNCRDIHQPHSYPLADPDRGDRSSGPVLTGQTVACCQSPDPAWQTALSGGGAAEPNRADSCEAPTVYRPVNGRSGRSSGLVPPARECVVNEA